MLGKLNLLTEISLRNEYCVTFFIQLGYFQDNAAQSLSFKLNKMAPKMSFP